jgi:hypothetical protein
VHRIDVSDDRRTAESVLAIELAKRRRLDGRFAGEAKRPAAIEAPPRGRSGLPPVCREGEIRQP